MFLNFNYYLKVHPKVGVKYNRTLIYTQMPDPSKLEYPKQPRIKKYEKKVLHYQQEQTEKTLTSRHLGQINLKGRTLSPSKIWFAEKNVDFKDSTTVRMLYCSLVRPLLEYSCETWNPHILTLILIDWRQFRGGQLSLS